MSTHETGSSPELPERMKRALYRIVQSAERQGIPTDALIHEIGIQKAAVRDEIATSLLTPGEEPIAILKTDQRQHEEW